MIKPMRGVAVAIGLLAACAEPPIGPVEGGTLDPGPGPETPGAITVTLDNLEPGWRVTASRLVDHDAPTEETITSDGSPITLTGTATNVFFATVTDQAGQLKSTHGMKSPCTMSSAHQLHVPGDYPTIQAAIDAASPGDTVKVAAGTYTESVQLRSGVCLLGAGAKHTILDAQHQGRTLVDLSSAPGSAVVGFTFRNVTPAEGCANEDVFTCSGDWYTAAVAIGSDALGWDNPTINAPPLIANNVFESNYIGVLLYFHGIAVVRNNIFVGNRSGLVANHYQDRTLVANNVFVDNTELAIGNQAAFLDIINNAIVGSPVGVRFMYIQTGHIACNLFFGNAANQRDEYEAPERFTIGTDGNIGTDPHFVGNGDYHLTSSSPGKDHGCHQGQAFEPDGSAPDIGAFGGPLAAWADL